MTGFDETNVTEENSAHVNDVVEQKSDVSHETSDDAKGGVPARQTGLNPGEEGRPVTPQFGESPAPIPANNSPVQGPPQGEWVFLPRTDTREIQPAPAVTYRSLAVPVEEAPRDTAKTAGAGSKGVATIPVGGLVELARLVYGDENRAVDIFNANRDILTSPDAHMVGHTTVRLPD